MVKWTRAEHRAEVLGEVTRVDATDESSHVSKRQRGVLEQVSGTLHSKGVEVSKRWDADPLVEQMGESGRRQTDCPREGA